MPRKNTKNQNDSMRISEILMVLEKMRGDFAVVSEHQSGKIDALSDRMDSFEGRMDKRFEQVDKRFEQVDKRFEQVDKRFEQVDKRFDKMDEHFEQVDKRNAEADERAKVTFEYLSKIEDEVVELSKKENKNEKDIDILQEKVMKLVAQ